MGIGVTTPAYRLDVGDRMRVRQGSAGTAGIWFYQSGPPAADRAFVGMANNDYVGFWGNAGAQWGLVMNVTNGNVGIGTLEPASHVTISRPNEAAAYQLELRNVGLITTGNFDGIRFTQGPTGSTPLGGIRLLYKSNGFTQMGFYLRDFSNPNQEAPRIIFTDSGAIRFTYGVQTSPASTEPATLMLFNNERHWGGGAEDGFRMRFHGGVGGFPSTDLWIFEKTDGNDPYPDGAIVFRMYGTQGPFNALNIIGHGSMGAVVGVNTGTSTPTAPFEVRKPIGGGPGNGSTSDLPTTAIITDISGSRYNDWPNGWGGGLSTWDIVCASIRLSGTSTRSDRKYKRDIKSLSTAELLPRFMALRPVSYYYRSDIKVCDDPERLRFGFIANEVEELFPNLVDNAGLPDSIARGLEYDGFIPILVSVVQAQQRELEALRRQVADWEVRYKALENRWEELAGEVRRLRRRKEGDIVSV
ncbi:MAG: tail fiber domain-containing protein, partial [Bacteroidia bacterium]|nr:tail fiber domain-containing protein [Bacteroidia bacterium]